MGNYLTFLCPNCSQYRDIAVNKDNKVKKGYGWYRIGITKTKQGIISKINITCKRCGKTYNIFSDCEYHFNIFKEN